MCFLWLVGTAKHGDVGGYSQQCEGDICLIKWYRIKKIRGGELFKGHSKITKFCLVYMWHKFCMSILHFQWFYLSNISLCNSGSCELVKSISWSICCHCSLCVCWSTACKFWKAAGAELSCLLKWISLHAALWYKPEGRWFESWWGH
jgi:hypothetical protein